MVLARRYYGDLLALLGYVGLTIGMTWPAVSHLSTHFLGQNIDLWINLWATWWTRRALLGEDSLYHTTMLFFPRGTSLIFHSFSHVNTAVELFLGLLVEPLTAYNLVILAALPLSGYAMFCLVRHLTQAPTAAWIAGLVFAFYPYRMAEIVHPVLVSTQWMPFYMLYLIRYMEERSSRHLGMATLFFVLNALTSWHLMIFASFMSGCYLLILGLCESRHRSTAALTRIAILVGVISIVMLPFLAPLIREQLSVEEPYMAVAQDETQGNDLAVFFLPAEQHPILGKLTIPAHARTKNTRAAYLGIAVLVLTIVAAKLDWRRSRIWIILTLLSALLSLHPQLRIWGHEFPFTLPWSLVVSRILRHPFRFSIVLGFSLSVSSGIGFHRLVTRYLHTPTRRTAAAAITTVCILFEYLYFPFPLTPARASAYYDAVQKDTHGAILDLPMGRDPARYYLYYQMLHGRPIVEGIVSRTPVEAYSFIEETPYLRSLRACGAGAVPAADLGPAASALQAVGIDEIIVHKDLISEQALGLWTQSRRTLPDYEDADIVVYRTKTESGLQPDARQLLEGCMSVRPLTAKTLTEAPGGSVTVTLEWVTGAPPVEDYVLELGLVGDDGETYQRHWYQVAPGTSITLWHAGKIHTATYTFQVSPTVGAGVYRLRARLLPPSGDRENTLEADIAALTVLPMDTTGPLRVRQYDDVDVIFGNKVQLNAYTISQAATALHALFHFHAVAPVEEDYKLFVHLYDSRGTLVAQVDAMPQEWTYRTSAWAPGQVLVDEVTLPLSGIAPGTYHLGLGFYAVDDGERLGATSLNTALDTRDGRLLLEEDILIEVTWDTP